MFKGVIQKGSIYQDMLINKHAFLVLYSNRRLNHGKEIAKSDVVKGSNTENNKASEGPPEVPTNCCMSGCPTCVWLDYAEKLVEHYKDGDEKAIKEINEKITDPSLKAYLLFELRMRLKKK